MTAWNNPVLRSKRQRRYLLSEQNGGITLCGECAGHNLYRVLENVWLMRLISKQQAQIVKGHRPPHINTVTKSLDTFFSMLNFLFEEHLTKKNMNNILP